MPERAANDNLLYHFEWVARFYSFKLIAKHQMIIYLFWIFAQRAVTNTARDRHLISVLCETSARTHWRLMSRLLDIRLSKKAKLKDKRFRWRTTNGGAHDLDPFDRLTSVSRKRFPIQTQSKQIENHLLLITTRSMIIKSVEVSSIDDHCLLPALIEPHWYLISPIDWN